MIVRIVKFEKKLAFQLKGTIKCHLLRNAICNNQYKTVIYSEPDLGNKELCILH